MRGGRSGQKLCMSKATKTLVCLTPSANNIHRHVPFATQLYDLADFQRQAEADEPSERPFGYSVGMMCFRMGDRCDPWLSCMHTCGLWALVCDGCVYVCRWVVCAPA